VNSPGRIALFLNAAMGGGAERIVIELGRWLAEHGHPVDLVLAERRGPLLDLVPESMRVVELGARSRLATLPSVLRFPLASQPDLVRMLRRSSVMRSLLPFAAYLRREQPRALLTTMAKNALLSLFARHLADNDVRLVVREANVFSLQFAGDLSRTNRILRRLAESWYPRADAFIAISAGVADDLAATVGVSPDLISMIHNPVLAERIASQAREPLDDPWLKPGGPPVLVSAGRLTEQKDFETLLRAFALLRRERPVRLIVLGEGRKRSELEAMCGELEIEHDVSFPGFVRNPHAYIARAAVFVLSSTWEGFANVVGEALASGCAVVSTDCPSGPAEILDRGRYGTLVPPRDVAGLAKAIAATLDHPPDAERLRARAREFAPDPIFEQYLAVIAGEPTAG